MKNFLFNLCYDGKHYHGWQVQKNAHSVQEEFQNALKKVIQNSFDLKGCSRTDAGVHANMYCVSVKANCKISAYRMPLALNRFLPSSIAVLTCTEVPLNFHARYDCTGKEYIYKIWNNTRRNPFLDGYALHYWRALNISMMQEAAKEFVGMHDFSSFCTMDARKKGNLIRTVNKFEISGEAGNLIIMSVEADGFLYNMVRIMVGTLLRISEGKIPQNGIKDILLAKNRSKAGLTACACGLYLNKVNYN